MSQGTAGKEFTIGLNETKLGIVAPFWYVLYSIFCVRACVRMVCVCVCTGVLLTYMTSRLRACLSLMICMILSLSLSLSKSATDFRLPQQ